jgi:hypothetical protein
MAIKHFLVTYHSEQEMHQIFTYTDFNIGFVSYPVGARGPFPGGKASGA